MNKEIVEYIKSLSDNKIIQERMISIIGKILLSQENFEKFIQKNNDKIVHIRDWISSVIENNETWKQPRVLTVEALNNAADKYFEKKNNKLKIIELDEHHEKLIADLGDFYIVQMLTPQALDNESKIMQHCIGHGYYDQNLNRKEYQYLSLRDKFNKPHATLEILNNVVLQLQGKQNKTPERKYLEKLVTWLTRQKYNFKLKNYGLIINQKDNKIYSIYDMPDNCEVREDLIFREIGGNDRLKRLPNNLTIHGKLDLTNCREIKELPRGLIVHGDFVAMLSNIKELPNDLKVNGDIDLCESYQFEKIPNNFTFNGNNLYLYGCENLRKLPKGLKVNGYLNVGRTAIEKFPRDIFVKNEIIYSVHGRVETMKEIPEFLLEEEKPYLQEKCKNIFEKIKEKVFEFKRI